MFQTTNQMMFMCSDGIKSTLNSLMVEYGLRDDPNSLKMTWFWLGFWGAENITPQSSKLGSPKLHWPNCSFDAETRFTLDSNPKSIEPANHPRLLSILRIISTSPNGWAGSVVHPTS